MNRRDIVIGLGIGSLSVFGAAAGIYAYYGRRSLATAPSSAPAQAPSLPAARSPAPIAGDARGLVRFHSPIIGPVNAPVTIVEFLDPSCEACRAMYPAVKQILATFPNEVRLVIRYTPFHRGSEEAVRVLEAARAQGRFEPVLEALFARQDEWASHSNPNPLRIWEIAGAAGVDLTRGRVHAASESVTQILQQDIADVRANMIRGTPTFYINGTLVDDFAPSILMDRVRNEVRRMASAPRQ